MLWAPPGGGMLFGSPAEKNLEREFVEETGLEISTEKFLFVHEYLEPPLHAIELFFKVRLTGGKLGKGRDPEMGEAEQIIRQVAFLGIEEISSLEENQIHSVFHKIGRIEDILSLSGFYPMKSGPKFG
jgi:8-oxo-dGTP diphosphatase